MISIEITQEAYDALTASKFETASDAILATMPKKRGTRKPESWKLFFATYPANKKGGTDASAWKAAKREGLTEEDFKLMLDDVINRAKLMPSWATTYAQGIARYISDKIWLTPITPEVAKNGQNQYTGVTSQRASAAQRSAEQTYGVLARPQASGGNAEILQCDARNVQEPLGICGGATQEAVPINGRGDIHGEFSLVVEEDGTVIDRRDSQGANVL